MYITQEELDWLKGHAVRGDKGMWQCRETGETIEFEAIRRPTVDESGHPLVVIAHLCCPGCLQYGADEVGRGPIFSTEAKKLLLVSKVC